MSKFQKKSQNFKISVMESLTKLQNELFAQEKKSLNEGLSTYASTTTNFPNQSPP